MGAHSEAPAEAGILLIAQDSGSKKSPRKIGRPGSYGPVRSGGYLPAGLSPGHGNAPRRHDVGPTRRDQRAG